MCYLRSTSRALLGALLALALLPMPALAITRDVAISRGKVWVVKRTPYSQSRYAFENGVLVPKTAKPTPSALGYRTDCSGFASMALNLRTSTGAPRALDSRSLLSVLKPIGKTDLRAGDIVLRPKGSNVAYGHAVVFVAWTDATLKSYWSYEESGGSGRTITRKVPYPFFNESGFAPYRYTGIQDTFAECELALYGVSRWENAVAAATMQVEATSSVSTSPTVPAVPAAPSTAVIVGGDAWTDALSGSALAGAYRAPMLLTAPTVLPNATRLALRRFKPARVFIVGTTTSVRPAVQAQIVAMGIRVTRISGANASEIAAASARTAVAQARARGKVVDTAYITTSRTSPDALAAVPIASATGRPILLAGLYSLPAPTVKALRDLHIKKVVVLGSTASISYKVQRALIANKVSVQRIGSLDAYGTALAIARSGAGPDVGFKNLGVVSGSPVTDAVCAGVAQGQTGGLLLLTPSSSLEPRVAAEIAAHKREIGVMRVYGGFTSISQRVRASIATLLKADL